MWGGGVGGVHQDVPFLTRGERAVVVPPLTAMEKVPFGCTLLVLKKLFRPHRGPPDPAGSDSITASPS